MSLAVGFDRVAVVEAPGGLPGVRLYPIDADETHVGDAPRLCPADISCSDRPMAVVDGGATVLVATENDGLLRCNAESECVVDSAVSGGSLAGLGVLGDELLFLQTASSDPDLGALDLASGRPRVRADIEAANDAFAMALRGEDVFWTTGFTGSAEAGLARRFGDATTETLRTATDGAPTKGIATDGSALFWRQGGAVMTLAPGCSTRMLVAPAGPPDRAWTIEVDSTFVYFDYGGELSVYRCDKGLLAGGPPTAPVCEVLSQGASGHVAGDATWVVYARGGQIKRVRKAPPTAAPR